MHTFLMRERKLFFRNIFSLLYIRVVVSHVSHSPTALRPNGLRVGHMSHGVPQSQRQFIIYFLIFACEAHYNAFCWDSVYSFCLCHVAPPRLDQPS